MMFNFEQWNHLLQQYVNDQGQVDYQRWKTENSTALSQWLAKIREIDLTALTSDQSLAFWLNLYNALTIKQVLDHYPMDSIFPKILGIPNLIAFFTFFQRPLWSNVGRRYSLNRIEHGILRKQFNDPRIHFALVCASVGCPLLRPQAYNPQQVQQQLSEDAYRFIRNPAKVRYEPEQNCLYLSKIFRWYGQDFAKVAPSVPQYIQTYLDFPLSPSLSIRYLPYDWSLNQRIS